MKKILFILLAGILFLSSNAQIYYEDVYDSVVVTSDILYGNNIDYNGNSTDLYLDTYEGYQDTAQQRPLMIMAHGGSFISGTKDSQDMIDFATAFAKKGYFVVSIQYRLGVNYSAVIGGQGNEEFTTAVLRATHDMKAAIRFFVKDRETANIYKIDTSKIIVGGASAGAITAIHLAYLEDLANVADVVDTNGIGGLAGNSGNPGYNDIPKCVVNLCGAIGDTAWMYNHNIPVVSMHGDQDQTVPYGSAMLTMSGIDIREVDGSHSIMEKCNQIGLLNQLHTWVGQDHCPQMSNTAYMDTSIWITRDFLYNYFFNNSDIKKIEENNISIYPNPAKNIINIKIDSRLYGIDNIEIYNISGKCVISTSIENYNKIDISNLKQGIYFVRIGEYSSKFVKTN